VVFSQENPVKPQMTQIAQMRRGKHRKHRKMVITYVVAKRLWRQFFLGVRRRVAAFQSGAEAPHSKKWRFQGQVSAPEPHAGRGRGRGQRSGGGPKENAV